MGRALSLESELGRDRKAFDPGLGLLDGLVDQIGADVATGAGNLGVQVDTAFNKRTIMRVGPEMELEHRGQLAVVDGAFQRGVAIGGSAAPETAEILGRLEPAFPEARGGAGLGLLVTAFLEHVHEQLLAKERGQAMERLGMGFEQADEEFD